MNASFFETGERQKESVPSTEQPPRAAEEPELEIDLSGEAETPQIDELPVTTEDDDGGFTAFMTLERERLGDKATPVVLQQTAQRWLNARFTPEQRSEPSPAPHSPPAPSDPYAPIQARIDVALDNIIRIEDSLVIARQMHQLDPSEEVRQQIVALEREKADSQGAIAWANAERNRVETEVASQTRQTALSGLGSTLSGLLRNEWGVQEVKLDNLEDRLPEGLRQKELYKLLLDFPFVSDMVAKSLAYDELKTKRRKPPKAPDASGFLPQGGAQQRVAQQQQSGKKGADEGRVVTLDFMTKGFGGKQ